MLRELLACLLACMRALLLLFFLFGFWPITSHHSTLHALRLPVGIFLSVPVFFGFTSFYWLRGFCVCGDEMGMDYGMGI